MSTCYFVDYLDFDLHLDQYQIYHTPIIRICRGVYISSSFLPIIRSFVRQSARPFVNFTSKFCNKPF